MKYTFEVSNDMSRVPYTGKLINILELTPQYSEDATELHGKLLAVFGEPAYTTNNLENVYEYIIVAKGEDGSEHVLSVYEGASGPAIGGENSALEAANELKRHIRSAKPMDYEYRGFYFDGPTKIHRGVFNGKLFFSEVEVADDDEEYVQALKEAYPGI